MKCILLQAYRGEPTFAEQLVKYLLIIFVVLAVVSIARGGAMLKTVLSHWHHRFTTPPFSSQEFYKAVETQLTEKEMHKLSVSRVTYAQGGILSPSREYLRIQYKELIYDICAAPFGKEYFVSWWLGETGNATRDFFINLPIIGKFFTKREKTFFELDTEMMFKEAVTSCVKEAIEVLTKDKGMRTLEASDWKEYNRSFQ